MNLKCIRISYCVTEPKSNERPIRETLDMKLYNRRKKIVKYKTMELEKELHHY